MYIDSHCHLDFSEFDHDLDEVVARAQANEVMGYIVPGVKRAHWQRQQALAKRYSSCRLAFGIHPFFLQGFDWQDIDALDNQLHGSDCVAVGECGIDGVVDDIELQSAVFLAQIELANQHRLPLIVHHRRSHHLLHAAFKRVKPGNGGIIHAFSGSMADAKKYLALGFKLGCGGVITYPRAEKTRKVFKKLGIEHLVLETDSPSMPLNGYQGLRNEPSRIRQVVAALSELTGEALDTIADQTCSNVKAVFSLPDSFGT